MPRNILNNGTVSNDGTGDSLRDAFTKINNNFIEIYNKLGGTDSGDYLSQGVKFDSANIIFGQGNLLTLGASTSLSSNRKISLPDASGTLLINTDNQLISNPLLSGNILDSNSNELITLSPTASAANSVKISNSTTGSPVIISTDGTDTNVGLSLQTKGTGTIAVDRGFVYGTEIVTTDTIAININKPFTLFNRATAITATLADASSTGHSIKMVNINSGTVTVTPSNFLNGTSFTVPQNAYAEVIWTGSSWLIHADTDVTIT